MLGLIVALALAPATAAPTPPSASAATTAALPTAPWWEKITVTMSGDGKTKSCKYESSSATADASKPCKIVGSAEAASRAQSGANKAASAELSTITFERRFEPGQTPPQETKVAVGDTLLGREVMALAIDAAGKVSGCKTVVKSGDMALEYGCAEATAERFESTSARASAEPRNGFMTILIYGHSEHVA